MWEIERYYNKTVRYKALTNLMATELPRHVTHQLLNNPIVLRCDKGGFKRQPWKKSCKGRANQLTMLLKETQYCCECNCFGHSIGCMMIEISKVVGE